jgi:hypothetical protein
LTNESEMLKAFDVEKIIRLIKFLLPEMFLRFRIVRQFIKVYYMHYKIGAKGKRFTVVLVSFILGHPLIVKQHLTQRKSLFSKYFVYNCFCQQSTVAVIVLL